MHDLKIGDRFESTLIVEESHTASAFGSGDLFVFSTPMMIGLMENAALRCAQKKLDAGFGTVGISVEVKHIAATPMGQSVRAVAEIIAIEGKKISFEVEAYDEVELIGKGVHERFIIDNEKFMKRLASKRGEHENN